MELYIHFKSENMSLVGIETKQNKGEKRGKGRLNTNFVLNNTDDSGISMLPEFKKRWNEYERKTK